MTTHIDLHVVDLTGRDHLVRASLADEGDWIVRASIDGRSFTRQCGSWQGVERTLYWFRRYFANPAFNRGEYFGAR